MYRATSTNHWLDIHLHERIKWLHLLLQSASEAKLSSICMQIDDVYHIDGLEVLKGSKLLRTSARAVKNHSQNADVFQHAVALLNMLLTDYQSSSCFDALVEEVLDSNLALEMEIAVRDRAQVT